jgi:hypothetical protein
MRGIKIIKISNRNKVKHALWLFIRIRIVKIYGRRMKSVSHPYLRIRIIKIYKKQ